MSANLKDFVNYKLRHCLSRNRYSVGARITSLSSILGISPFVFLETKLKREYFGACCDIGKHLFSILFFNWNILVSDKNGKIPVNESEGGS